MSYSKKIGWTGKITLSDKSLSQEQYNKFFDADSITYNLALKTMEICNHSPYELTADYFNHVTRQEVVNRLTYGDKWMSQSFFADLPTLHEEISCTENGEAINFRDLPAVVKKYISQKLLNVEETGTVSVSTRM